MKNKLNSQEQVKKDAMLVVEFLNATTPKWEPTLKEEFGFIQDTIVEVKEKISKIEDLPLEYIEKLDEAYSLISDVREVVLSSTCVPSSTLFQ